MIVNLSFESIKFNVFYVIVAVSKTQKTFSGKQQIVKFGREGG